MAENKKHPAGSSVWQIIVPTSAAAALVVLAGIWFAVFAGPASVSRFAEISTVLLVVPFTLAALASALLLAGFTFLVVKVMEWVPWLTERVLQVLEKIRQVAQAVSRFAAGLFIGPASFLARFRRVEKPPDPNIKLVD